MRPALVVIAVAACGQRAPVVVDDTLGGIEDELPGTCVDAAPASTVATIRELGRDAVVFCAGEPATCRKVELATGAMVAPSDDRSADEPARVQPVIDHAGHDLQVCAGEAACRRAIAEPGDRFDTAALAVDGRVAAVVESQRGFDVVVLDAATLAPAARFKPPDAPGDLRWLGGAIYLTTVDAGVTHGRLYEPDGTPIAMVGGDDAPIDVRRGVPIRIAVTAWAWLDATSRVVALHDVRKRTRARIDLDVTDVPVAASDARGTPDGRIVIALGGTRYGDIVVVEPIEGVVTLRRARRCEAAT